MIGLLPTSLEIDGEQYEINSDFRIALLIFEAYADKELTYGEKTAVCLNCLYKEVPKNVEEALKKALWFLDGGDVPKSKKAPVKIIDWSYDESIIFPALNKVAGFETRIASYVHWWTFLGYFSEVGDCLLSQVMNIRQKRAKGKELEKWELDFYNEHKELVDIKEKLTPEEQAELDAEEDFINNLV